MIEVSMTEVLLLISNIVSWALYFKTDERRRAAEFFARAMVQDKEIHEKVLSQYDEFKRDNA